jgi:hypothetical protein
MAKTSVYYTLGVYLAKHMMDRHIPSLSCNQCTNNVVQVTWGEAQELERLEDAWLSKLNDERRNLRDVDGMKSWEKDNKAQEVSKNEWNELMKHRYILKEKYLPHVIKCNVPDVDFSNEKNNEKIKKGMIETLWDWDFCEWSLKEEDIIFENENDTFGANDKYSMQFSYITLKLDLEAPSSFTGDEWIEIKTPQKEIR